MIRISRQLLRNIEIFKHFKMKMFESANKSIIKKLTQSSYSSFYKHHIVSDQFFSSTSYYLDCRYDESQFFFLWLISFHFPLNLFEGCSWSYSTIKSRYVRSVKANSYFSLQTDLVENGKKSVTRKRIEIHRSGNQDNMK